MSRSDPFPPLYDAHHKLHLEDLPFWLELAAGASGPILELGCGTGRVTLPLAHAGYSVYALDIDFAMVNWILYQRSPELTDHIHLLQADFTRLPFAGQFPLIIMPCNTCSTLSQPQRAEMLRQVCRHLQPEGFFCASMPNPEVLSRQRRRSAPQVEEIFLHPLDGNPVQVSSEWTRTSSVFTITWHYDHLLPNGQVNRFSARLQHSLQSVDEYLAEFHAAGLQIVQLYGDFARHPYQTDAEHLIIIAQRTKAHATHRVHRGIGSSNK